MILISLVFSPPHVSHKILLCVIEYFVFLKSPPWIQGPGVLIVRNWMH